jgi:hypothetical protein
MHQQNWIQVKPFCYVAEAINTDKNTLNTNYKPDIIDMENVCRADNGEQC